MIFYSFNWEFQTIGNMKVSNLLGQFCGGF